MKQLPKFLGGRTNHENWILLIFFPDTKKNNQIVIIWCCARLIRPASAAGRPIKWSINFRRAAKQSRTKHFAFNEISQVDQL